MCLRSLTAPVAPSTDWTWSYEFDLDGNGESPASAPYWWMAKAVDTSGNVSVACHQQLHSDGDTGDVTAPLVAIGAPANYASVPDPVVVSGTAFDEVGVAEVRVEIFDRETGWWWNDTGWQASRTYVFADR